MSVATNKIKGRIKSVTSAYKVTSAMKLVSSVKLNRWKNKMISFSKYSFYIDQAVNELLSFIPLKVASPYLKQNDPKKKKLYLIVSSTLGLCGAYNSNIFKLTEQVLSPYDDIIVFGKKGIARLDNGEFNVIKGYEDTSLLTEQDFTNQLADTIMDDYLKEKYSEIILIYSEYKNSLIFLAKKLTLLPFCNNVKHNDVGYPPIFEPNAQEVVNNLIPFYLKTNLYSKLLQSEVCEQASRSNAMENATNNAKEILDNLNIEYNKARQSSITQEIIEIVGASEAI